MNEWIWSVFFMFCFCFCFVVLFLFVCGMKTTKYERMALPMKVNCLMDVWCLMFDVRCLMFLSFLSIFMKWIRVCFSTSNAQEKHRRKRKSGGEKEREMEERIFFAAWNQGKDSSLRRSGGDVRVVRDNENIRVMEFKYWNEYCDIRYVTRV